MEPIIHQRLTRIRKFWKVKAKEVEGVEGNCSSIIKSKKVGVHDIMEDFLRGQIHILFSFITTINIHFLESRENKIKFSFKLFSFLQGLRTIPN